MYYYCKIVVVQSYLLLEVVFRIYTAEHISFCSISPLGMVLTPIEEIKINGHYL